MRDSVVFIESEANARFKRWKKLAAEPRAVKKESASLIEGIHLMQSALEAGWPVKAVMLNADGAAGEARDLAEAAAKRCGARLFELPAALYRVLSPVEHGAGVIAEIPVRKPAAWPEGDVLYLDGVQDAGNAGTLIRTAVAAGVRVIAASPSTATLWAPKVLRAGMGAHFGAAIVENVTPEALRGSFKGLIAAADARGGEDLFAARDPWFSGRVAWILGAEGPGVSEAALAVADRRFYIPIEAACESLNVGAAAAVCLFEQRRRRLAEHS
jgi:TrmH family RNA methyltransferase